MNSGVGETPQCVCNNFVKVAFWPITRISDRKNHL